MYIFIIVGSIFSLIGLYLLNKNLNKIKKGEKCNGVIIDHEVTYSRNNNGGRNRLYYEIIEFQTQKDGVLTKKSEIASSLPKKLNEKVEVFYLKEENSVLVNTIFRIYLFPLFFTLFGLIFVVIGFLE